MRGQQELLLCAQQGSWGGLPAIRVVEPLVQTSVVQTWCMPLLEPTFVMLLLQLIQSMHQQLLWDCC